MIEVYDTESVHEDIAAVVARQPEFASAAAKVFAEIEASAAAHMQTGEQVASFSLEQGKVDWSISPSTDHDAAVEFGHYVYQDAQGRRTSRQGARYRTWVPGINVMRGVVRANGGF